MVGNVFEHTVTLIYLYLLLAYLGIGAFALTTPPFFKKPYLYLLVAPGFGFCLLAAIGSWVIAVNVTVVWAMIVSLSIATGLNLLMLWRAGVSKRGFLNRFRPAKNTLLKVIPATVLLLVVLYLIILPGIRQGNLTTPVRMGPDQLGYAGAAQALANGETLSSIAEDLKAVTGEEDLEEAKELNFQLLRFDLHCSSEFLLKAQRWGYPAILGTMTWVTGFDSVYRLDFVLLIFSCAMLFGLAYHAARSVIGAPWYVSSLLAGALALNCNLLNIYYEGSYAQVMATPILFMLLMNLYDLRKNGALRNRSSRIRQVAFVGFLCAGLLSIWNEAFVLLAIVCLLVVVIDLVLARRLKKAWMAVYVAGALLAFCLVAPLTLHLVLMVKGQLFTHLHNISVGGWWQPQWATPPEMMGWLDIYAHGSQSYVIPRSSFEVVSVLLGSLVILAAAGYYVLSNKRLDRAFWLAPIILVLLVFAKCMFRDRFNNYQYYKAYAAFLPIVFVFTYAAFFHTALMIKARLKYVLFAFIALTIFVTAFTGVSYIRKYCRDSLFYTQEMADLQNHSDLLSTHVLMTAYGPHYTQVTQLAATGRMNWYNFAFEDGYGARLIKEPYLEMPVAIILFDVSDDDRAALSIDGDDVLYSGEEFLVVKTPYKLKDRLDENGNVVIENYLDSG